MEGDCMSYWDGLDEELQVIDALQEDREVSTDPLAQFVELVDALTPADKDNLEAVWSQASNSPEFIQAWEEGARALASVRFTKLIYSVVPDRFPNARQGLIALFMAMVLDDSQLSSSSRSALMRPWQLHQRSRSPIVR